MSTQVFKFLSIQVFFMHLSIYKALLSAWAFQKRFIIEIVWCNPSKPASIWRRRRSYYLPNSLI